MWKYLVLRLCFPIVGRFPGISYAIADVVGLVAWRFRPTVRRRVRKNLLPACRGDRERTKGASLEVVRNVARYYVDIASLPRRDLSVLEAQDLDITGADRLAVLDEKRRVIIVSAHAGNPELVIQALAYRERPFTALVERLEPRSYAEAMLQARSAAGGHFYESGFRGVRAALRDLRAGSVLALMADRDIRGTGVCVDFMERRVKMPRGPWQIARREGALVLPILCSRRDGTRSRVFVHEPYEVGQSDDADMDIWRAASRWAGLLEEHIYRDPGQWTVLEDFWETHGCAAHQDCAGGARHPEPGTSTGPERLGG